MSRESTMMAVYLFVIALGVVMIEQRPIMGMVQILVGAGLFGLRLHRILKQRSAPDT